MAIENDNALALERLRVRIVAARHWQQKYGRKHRGETFVRSHWRRVGQR